MAHPRGIALSLLIEPQGARFRGFCSTDHRPGHLVAGLRVLVVDLGAEEAPEDVVADRTGHKSSVMIQSYRRAARTVAELGLGDLSPLDQCIPALAPPPGASPRRRARSPRPP